MCSFAVSCDDLQLRRYIRKLPCELREVFDYCLNHESHEELEEHEVDKPRRREDAEVPRR
jgi:hypothetical protein